MARDQRETPGLRAGDPHEVRPARLTSWRVMSARAGASKGCGVASMATAGR